MAWWRTSCCRQNLRETIQTRDVSDVFVLYSHHSHFWFYRRNAGGCVIEETSQISKEAQRRTRQELATRTGDTDSEEDGPSIDDEELEYQEPNEYEDEQRHQDDDGDHVRGWNGAEEEHWEYAGRRWWWATCSPSHFYTSSCILLYFNNNLISILHSVLARLVKIIPIILRLLAIAQVVLYCRFTMMQYSTT